MFLPSSAHSCVAHSSAAAHVPKKHAAVLHVCCLCLAEAWLAHVHCVEPPRTAGHAEAGWALLLAGIEGARGRRLDPDLEDLMTSFGTAFLILASIWLVTRDLDSLASFLSHPPPPPELPMAAMGGGSGPAVPPPN